MDYNGSSVLVVLAMHTHSVMHPVNETEAPSDAASCYAQWSITLLLCYSVTDSRC
ncbi:MAG: hypothetical protein J6T38_01490 [Bacteroidaceae bacterium]|nr:hypothetical protein [Bacteroidaceae bacterium]